MSSDAALYVHLPFCETKCGYCDFFSLAINGRETTPLVRAVCAELRARVPDARRRIRTIFVGGGTPTVLPSGQLEHVLRTIHEVTAGSSPIEFTVEANPGTIDQAKAGALVAAGVTRVSMGAQSFDAEELNVLERIHDPAAIAPAVETVRRAGVADVNLDLIFGIPGQSLHSWAASLRRATELEPDHVAAYGLMYEPGTRLTAQRDRGVVRPCDDGLEAEMYLLMVEHLRAAGYEQYEISNFARPGHHCRHNLMYWRNEDYIGVGPSAVGCYDDRRYRNVADVLRYPRWMDERGSAEAETETLDPATRALEMILMQMRLTEGLSAAEFTRCTGIEAGRIFADPIARYTASGHVVAADGRIALTVRGMLVADTIMADFAAAYDAARNVTVGGDAVLYEDAACSNRPALPSPTRPDTLIS
jgi:oxygen-independent coproporphyrinogen-3 oxidase